MAQQSLKLNINFWNWVFARDTITTPFNFLYDNGNPAQHVDLSKFSAHQYAMLDAYPGRDGALRFQRAKKLSEEVRNSYDYDEKEKKFIQPDVYNKPVIVDGDTGGISHQSRSSISNISDTYSPHSSPQIKDNALSNEKSANIQAILLQIEYTKFTLHPFSLLKYLACLLYYWLALEAQKKGMQASIAAFFLGLVAWPLYRLISLLHFVSALVFSPLSFMLTLSCKVTMATGSFLWRKLNEGVSPMSAMKTSSDHRTSSESSQAWETFKEQCQDAWDTSLCCFAPVTNIVDPLVKNAKRDRMWYAVLIPTVLVLIGIVGFTDFVLSQVAQELHSEHMIRSGFADQFGGQYAEIAWENIVAGLSLSWDNIQVGLEFFVYALLNKALVPMVDGIGFSMALTSHHTSQYVGTVLFETLLPLLGCLLIAYRFMSAKKVAVAPPKQFQDDNQQQLHNEENNASVNTSAVNDKANTVSNTHSQDDTKNVVVIDLSPKSSPCLLLSKLPLVTAVMKINDGKLKAKLGDSVV